MDNTAILQYLRESSLEEGRAYLSAHSEEFVQHDGIGISIADEALARLYSPLLSLKLAELLTFLGAATDYLSWHALGLKAQGDALVQLRLYEFALECLDLAAEEFLRLQDEENWARTRISWVVAATSLGRVEPALREAARAREIFVRLDQPYWVCVIDHNTALGYRQVGRYQEAHALYERILTIYPTLQDRSDVFIERAIAITKQSMAMNLFWHGKFGQAYRLQQEALDSYQTLAERDLQVIAELNLASFDDIQGYYGSALRRYHRVQDLLVQHTLDNPRMAALLKLQQATTLRKLNRVTEAYQLAHEAVEMYRRFDLSPDVVDALREYASTLAASGYLKDALTALKEVETLVTQGGWEHYILATRLQQAEVLLQMREFDVAYQSACGLKLLFDEKGLVPRSVHASLIMLDALLGQAEQQPETEQRVLLLQEAASLGKSVALQAQRAHLQEEVYRSQALLGRSL